MTTKLDSGRLKNSGYRLTGPRRAVLEVIQRSRGHLSPEEVFTLGRRRHRALGRATVYRTLDLLTQLGVLRPMYLGEGRPAYARLDHGHQHLVCSRCDRITEIEAADVERLGRRLARRLGFELRSHLLELYGLCPKCRGSAA